MDNSSQASNPNQGSFDPQQLTQQIAASYVDDYMPPVTTQSQNVPAAAPQSVTPTPTPTSIPNPVEQPEPVPQDQPQAVEPPNQVESELVIQQPSPLMKAEEPMPPMVAKVSEPAKPTDPTVNSTQDTPDQTSVTTSTPEPNQSSITEPIQTKSEPKTSQNLEDQNIFHLLGIESATEKEKDMFLDELQQIIWEDFLDNDVELLLTEEELVEFKKIQATVTLSEDEKQSQMVAFLEKLIPDLEKIMLEKALELKEAMFLERITQMKREFEEKSEVLIQIDKAEQQQKNELWRDAANALNAIAH